MQVNLGNSRGYRPTLPLKNFDVKLLKVRSETVWGCSGSTPLTCSAVVLCLLPANRCKSPLRLHFAVCLLALPCTVQPQNILGMLHAGTRDCGFAGHDWVQELGADVVEVMDTEMDPVRE